MGILSGNCGLYIALTKTNYMAHMNQEGMSGLIGSLVFYTMNGKSYVRSRPQYTTKKIKELSKSEPAQVFGQVSACVSALLNQLQPNLLFPLKRDAYNQCRSWMLRHYKANKDAVEWRISCLPNDQCQLQTVCDLRDIFRVQVSVEDLGGGKIRVSIPAIDPIQQLGTPPRTRKVHIRLMVHDLPFTDRGRFGSSEMAEISIPVSKGIQPASETLLQVKGKKNDLLFLTISLAFETASTKPGTGLADAAWQPAAVLGVGRRKE